MRCKRTRVLVLSIVTLTITGVFSGHTAKPGQSIPATSGLSELCLSQVELSKLVRNVSLGKYEGQQRAIALLKANADRSTLCRSRVITALISAMDQPDIDLTAGTPEFYLWHYGTRLLGELKAVEALDLLIRHFDRHDGTVFPLNHHPALVGVIDMGEVALPELQSALRENPDPDIRLYAVFCIAQIGGAAAHQILRQAAEGERDRCVASCIRATLSEFGNKRLPHHISDVGRTTWYTKFLCNGQ